MSFQTQSYSYCSTRFNTQFKNNFKAEARINRILAFSDVINWWFNEVEIHKLLVDKFQPDMVVLAGDLAFDGFAPFYWKDPLDELPKDEEFEKLRKKHVQGFYSFLFYAGKKSKVLVIKGNHDDDFEDGYSVKRINGIRGCTEVSGKIIEVRSITILGIPYNDAHNQRKLIRMSKNLAGKVDIVLMHGENVRLVSLLKPRLIIKGGGGTGVCLINDVPSVFTGPGSFSIICFENKTIKKISQYKLYFTFPSIGVKKMNLHMPAGYAEYKWVKPYKF